VDEQLLRAEFESWKESVTRDTAHSFLRGVQSALSSMAQRINALGLHREIRDYFDDLIEGRSVPRPGYFGADRRTLYSKSRR
jgi:hypothetical protein